MGSKELDETSLKSVYSESIQDVHGYCEVVDVQTGRRASLVGEQSRTEFGSDCWFLRGN